MGVHITLLCVGKIKESFYRQALEEYTKRLSRYCRLQIAEVQDEKTPDGAGEKEEASILEKEGKRLLARIPEGAFVCTLEIGGKALTSEQFAQRLQELQVQGVSEICFVIGGSLGLSPEVIARAQMHLSFSAMTFPHQLMRVILTEQIYRAFRILSGEPYHK